MPQQVSSLISITQGVRRPPLLGVSPRRDLLSHSSPPLALVYTCQRLRRSRSKYARMPPSGSKPRIGSRIPRPWECTHSPLVEHSKDRAPSSARFLLTCPY